MMLPSRWIAAAALLFALATIAATQVRHRRLRAPSSRSASTSFLELFSFSSSDSSDSSDSDSSYSSSSSDSASASSDSASSSSASKSSVSCLFDSDCDSGHCAGVAVVGRRRCVACEKDAHCAPDTDDFDEGVSPPGEAPAAFCIQEAGEEPRCSRWRRGTPIPDAGFPVLLGSTKDPGNNVLLVPRKTTASLPAVVFYHIPLDDQPEGTPRIEVDEASGVVKFPLSAHLRAGVTRSSDFGGAAGSARREVSLSNFGLFRNPRSILTDRSLVVLGEKTHVLTASGPEATHTVDRIRAQRAKRTPEAEADAHARRGERDRHVVRAAASSSMGDRMVESGQDAVQIGRIREFAALEHGTRGVDAKLQSRSWTLHAAKARDALRLAKNGSYARGSRSHCTHIETQKGASVDVEASRFVVRLDQNLVTLNGELSSAPAKSFSLRAGTLVAHYDRVHNAVDLYFAAAQHAWLNIDTHIDAASDPGLPPTALTVGPVDGVGLAEDVGEGGGGGGGAAEWSAAQEDGRTDAHYEIKSDFVKDLFLGGSANHHFEKALSIPVDYSRFERPRDEVCSASKLAALRSLFEKEYDMRKAKSKGWFQRMFYSAVYAGRVLKAMERVADCSVYFLSGDFAKTTGYDFVAFLGFGHILAELERSEVASVLAMQFWDDGVQIDRGTGKAPSGPAEGNAA